MLKPEIFELKRISTDAVDKALERAERYRLLNEPQQAESICHDVLAVDEGNQRARVILILATTDQLGDERCASGACARDAGSHLKHLEDEYERAYYAGIIRERRARAFLVRGQSAMFAYDVFRDAMDHYERAGELSPDANDDAILRWNACVRTIERENLRPFEGSQDELPLE